MNNRTMTPASSPTGLLREKTDNWHFIAPLIQKLRAIAAKNSALFVLFFCLFYSATSSALVNGGHIDGNILFSGETDSYSFYVANGESFQLRATDTSNNSFIPRLTLYKPDGSYVTFNQGYRVAAINTTASDTGNYTVVVSHGSAHHTSGNYRLYFVHTPGANEGGALSNGGKLSSLLDIGDLDSYTFDAALGENVQIRVADTSASDLIPRITLYGPSGNYITFNQGYNVSVINYAATETGTFSVVVSDYSGGYDGSGTYNIYFAHLPGANDGGALINGGKLSAELALGDIDSYTFTAALGENVQIRVADTSASDLIPRITLYGPSGDYITFNQGYNVSAVNYAATETGTYSVVISDYSGGYDGSGTYDIYFSQMPGANDGGSLAHGVAKSATIDLGDIDAYTLPAYSGEWITVTATDISGNNFIPRITLYNPLGAYVTYAQGYTVASRSFYATIPGTYTVVVSDHSGGYDATADYTIQYTGTPLP